MNTTSITWIGQAGLYIEHDDIKILIDPYLSDSCRSLNPLSGRRSPVDEKLFSVTPDIIVLTHDHLDHTDPETLKHFLTEHSNILVLASKNAWNHARTFGGNNNYVMFNAFTQWTYRDIKFSAVYAVHSDDFAIGVIIAIGGKKYYITGDTLYNTKVLENIPNDIDAVFLPVNGKGNNMNFEDAKRFAADCGAKKAVPLHWGMFDNLDPAQFDLSNAVIPEIYHKIDL